MPSIPPDRRIGRSSSRTTSPWRRTTPQGGGHAEFDGVAFHIAARSATLRRGAGVGGLRARNRAHRVGPLPNRRIRTSIHTHFLRPPDRWVLTQRKDRNGDRFTTGCPPLRRAPRLRCQHGSTLANDSRHRRRRHRNGFAQVRAYAGPCDCRGGRGEHRPSRIQMSRRTTTMPSPFQKNR